MLDSDNARGNKGDDDRKRNEFVNELNAIRKREVELLGLISPQNNENKLKELQDKIVSLTSELRAKDEELQLQKEELQAQNEELEVQKAELEEHNKDLKVNIEELAKLAETLRESEELNLRLASIVESSEDAIIAKTLDGVITNWNAAAERMFGYTADEAIGKNMSILVPPGYPNEIPTILERIKHGIRIEHYETIRITKDGKLIDVSVSTSPIKDKNGKIIGASSINRDITENKRAEEELKEAKQQSELYLDLMGHDISNMHQIAMGQLELANELMNEEGGLKVEEKELLEMPLEILNRSARLIDNVRNLQKMRRGEFKEESIDLNDLLSNIVKEYEFMVPSHAIGFQGNGPRCVMANKLLRDVFSNLVGNAIKHANRNGIEINIKLENASENGRNYYRVLVEDDGPGIPDDMKDKVFNRLQRGLTKARGLGLGLYLVKSLVDSYHGKVWVEDRVEGDHTKGSRFVVLLPTLEVSNGC